jgi:hypothetical protein
VCSGFRIVNGGRHLNDIIGRITAADSHAVDLVVRLWQPLTRVRWAILAVKAIHNEHLLMPVRRQGRNNLRPFGLAAFIHGHNLEITGQGGVKAA